MAKKTWFAKILKRKPDVRGAKERVVPPLVARDGRKPPGVRPEENPPVPNTNDKT